MEAEGKQLRFCNHTTHPAGLRREKGRKMNDWFCTVFPNDENELPQDFPTYEEAKEYGDEKFGIGNYTIESPC